MPFLQVKLSNWKCSLKQFQSSGDTVTKILYFSLGYTCHTLHRNKSCFNIVNQ